MSNDAAGFASATDRSAASPHGAFDAGLRPGPFPDRAASLLPGLLAATRTGLPPAGDDEQEQITTPISNHIVGLHSSWRTLRVTLTGASDVPSGAAGGGAGASVGSYSGVFASSHS